MSFLTFYNNIDCVEIDDDIFSFYENEELVMILPKSVLAAMVIHYNDILLDLEEKTQIGKKYWFDEETIIYTKHVFKNEQTSDSDDEQYDKILCIFKIHFELNLTKEAFQTMLITAAISCRIQADDSHRTSPFDLQYELDATKLIIFHDSRFFSLFNKYKQEQLDLPVSALAAMVIRKKEILRDLRDDSRTDCTIYWSSKNYQIKSEHRKNGRYLHITASYENKVIAIVMHDRTFESMIYIAISGPSWKENISDRMREIRRIFWNSIPLNTVKSIEFTKDGKEFTLINEETQGSLTLPISAFEAMMKSKIHILADLEDRRFQPTYKKDHINQYWTNGVYAIHTGVFYNLYRGIDCNVVRFTRLKDNYYEFLLQKPSFLWLLEQ